MSIATDIETGINDVKQFVGDHLGGILQRAAALEANPVITALEDAALGPAGEQMVVDFIGKLAAFAQSVAPAPAAEPAPAADVAAEQPAAVPGAVFGGQA